MAAELCQEAIRPQDCTPGVGPVNERKRNEHPSPYPDVEVPISPRPSSSWQADPGEPSTLRPSTRIP
jgi:hypothetical protein